MFNCMLCSWVQVSMIVCVQLNAQHCVRELDCSPDFFYYEVLLYCTPNLHSIV